MRARTWLAALMLGVAAWSGSVSWGGLSSLAWAEEGGDDGG